MKTLSTKRIIEAVKELCIRVNTNLPADVEKALEEGRQAEASPFGQAIFEQILRNAALAKEEMRPMCQDTGICVVFLNIGQDLHIVGGDLKKAIQEGVRQGYTEGYLRASMVEEPLYDRHNTKDNTPAVIHLDIVPGDELEIIVMPKGGGAENMGALGLLKPTAGEAGVIDFVVEAVRQAGGNPCPPIIVGIGLGGSMEQTTLLAKKALLRPVGRSHPDPRYAALEKTLLDKINAGGIGPQGLGGTVTALAVHIETYPAHIAMLPVAVNINCHAARHHHIVLKGEDHG